MALNINKPTNYGINANYFKIVNLEVSYHFKVARVELAGFVNEQARLDNKEPISSFEFRFSNEDFDFSTDQNLTQKLYDKIKTQENWTDATDC